MNVGNHIISQGTNKRELVEITKQGKRNTSRTFHQTKIGEKWINTRDLRRQ